MMWLKCWLLALVAAVLLDAAAAAITIDDFSVGPLSLVGPTGPTDYSGLDANHVIGGSRHIWVGLPSAPNTLDVSLGQLEFATGGGPDLGSLSLVYGESAPLGANLSAGDRDRVRVRFTEVTAAAPFSAGFTIRDAANQAFSFPIGNGMLALNGLDGVIELPFSAATINYANISRISLDLLGYTVNGTFAIDEIAVVPLPGGKLNSQDRYVRETIGAPEPCIRRSKLRIRPDGFHEQNPVPSAEARKELLGTLPDPVPAEMAVDNDREVLHPGTP